MTAVEVREAVEAVAVCRFCQCRYVTLRLRDGGVLFGHVLEVFEDGSVRVEDGSVRGREVSLVFCPSEILRMS